MGTNNRLLRAGAGTYDYDDECNRTRLTDTYTGDRLEYQWDHRNRLVRVLFRAADGGLAKTIDFTYYVYGNRIAKLVDEDADGTIDDTGGFVLDGDHVTLSFANGSLTYHILHEPLVDQVLSDELFTVGTRWALTDHLGSIRDLLNIAGGLIKHRDYDAFGYLTTATDTAPAIDFLFSYTSREFDSDLGLQYNRARWYDSGARRWISEDPIGFSAQTAHCDPGDSYTVRGQAWHIFP